MIQGSADVGGLNPGAVNEPGVMPFAPVPQFCPIAVAASSSDNRKGNIFFMMNLVFELIIEYGDKSIAINNASGKNRYTSYLFKF